MTCSHCANPARKTVVYLSRRTGKETSRTNLCDKHVQQELDLATSGLSMVDIDIRPLPPGTV